MYNIIVWHDGTSRCVTAADIATALDNAQRSSASVRALCRDGIRYSNQDFDVLSSAMHDLPREHRDALLRQSRKA